MTYPVRDRRGLRRLPDPSRADPARQAAAWLYGATARVAAMPWDLAWRRPRRAAVPVVSVGALTAGGAGKTPVVRWLARGLADAGLAPAILTRGYGSAGGADPRAVDPAQPDVRRDGDEPVLLARSLADVPVVVCPDRARGAAVAVSRGARVLVLDDGFQHRKLHREFDLVLWDRRAADSRGALLPAGPLREPVATLRRADVVLSVDRGDGAPLAPPYAAAVASGRLVTVCRQEVPAGTRMHAVSGVADPASFERGVEAAGFVLTGATRFPDHHSFSPDAIREAADRARQEGADVLATTAKDRMRWPREGAELPAPCVFDLDVRIERGELLLERIVAVVRGAER